MVRWKIPHLVPKSLRVNGPYIPVARWQWAALWIFLSAFSSTSTLALSPPSSATPGYTTVEWTDLLPQDDFDALMNPPDYLEDIEDGSEQDQIGSQMKNDTVTITEDRYQQALISDRVIDEYHNRSVRIPGFIVPLEFDDEQSITQFFLVPYFGACIHLPPPPPNQIIFVDFPGGFKLDALYTPFWISGVLKTESVNNDVAMSAYSMKMHKLDPYTE